MTDRTQIEYRISARATGRFSVRISKMPVQNSNSKISARSDLATNLLQILIPTIFNSLLCQKEQFILQLCPEVGLLSKLLDQHSI